ncbi:MAG: hypothetical protein HZB61_09160 [Nitrospirae bacterium]|nr:hypothetical protein [Nitrospirota bacterium]
MKKTAILIFSIVLTCLLFAAGCKKDEKSQPASDDNSQTEHKEPAPVPEGTPKY